MSERTDERSEDVDVDALLEDLETDSAEPEDVGFSEAELGVDVEALTADPETATDDGSVAADESAESSGLLARLRPSLSIPNPLAAVPSARSFLLAFVTVIISMALVGSIPVVGALAGAFGGVVGIFLGAFVLGLVSGQRRYVALAVVGAAVAGASAALDMFQLAILAGVGLAPFAVLGAGTGLLTAVAGHYFGRDLRAGLLGDFEPGDAG